MRSPFAASAASRMAIALGPTPWKARSPFFEWAAGPWAWYSDP